MSWHWSQAVWDCPQKEETNKTTHTPFQQGIKLGDKSPLSQHQAVSSLLVARLEAFEVDFSKFMTLQHCDEGSGQSAN